MNDITLTKEAAVSIREALSALIDSEKQAQAKQADDKSAESSKTAATKIADLMLSRGLITKEGYDRTVENLSSPVTAMPYLKKALDMVEASKATKTASDEPAEPKRVGKGVPPKYPAQKTSSDRLEEADRTFERAIGL